MLLNANPHLPKLINFETLISQLVNRESWNDYFIGVFL